MNPLHHHKDDCQRLGYCPRFWEDVGDLWFDFRMWFKFKVLRRKPKYKSVVDAILDQDPKDFPMFSAHGENKGLGHEWLTKK